VISLYTSSFQAPKSFFTKEFHFVVSIFFECNVMERCHWCLIHECNGMLINKPHTWTHYLWILRNMKIMKFVLSFKFFFFMFVIATTCIMVPFLFIPWQSLQKILNNLILCFHLAFMHLCLCFESEKLGLAHLKFCCVSVLKTY